MESFGSLEPFLSHKDLQDVIGQLYGCKAMEMDRLGKAIKIELSIDFFVLVLSFCYTGITMKQEYSLWSHWA